MMEFDLNYIFLKEHLLKAFNSLKEKYDHIKDFNLKIIFKTQTNLNSALVHNRLSNITNTKFFKAKKCKKNNCYSCYFLKFNSFYHPIHDNTNCESIGQS